MTLQTLLNRLESYIWVSLIDEESETVLIRRSAWDVDLMPYFQRFVIHIGIDEECQKGIKVHLIKEGCEDIILP